MRTHLIALIVLTTACGDPAADTAADTGADDTGGVVDECTDGDTQSGSTACGLNERGVLVQDCVGGEWIDSDTCDDPDECVDGDASTAACWDGRGEYTTTCVDGAWADGDCSLLAPARITIGPNAEEPDLGSSNPRLSRNGRFVAFQSYATNLVAEDTNGLEDVFLRDLQTLTTVLVSQATDGTRANGRSRSPFVSDDGRYVLFTSEATNLGDTRNHSDVFLRDVVGGTTTLVATAADGRGSVEGTRGGTLSADGSTIAFISEGDDLAAGDTNSAYPDVFLADVDTGALERLDIPGWPTQVLLSGDGNLLAYTYQPVARGAVIHSQVGLYDRTTQQYTRISETASGELGDGDSGPVVMSADGAFVAYISTATNLVAGDTGSDDDVYVYDVSTGATTHAAGGGTDGFVGNPSLSGDGALLAFDPGAVLGSNPEVYLRELATGDTVTPVTNTQGAAPDRGVSKPVIGGGHLAVTTASSDLVAGDTNGQLDLYVFPLP